MSRKTIYHISTANRSNSIWKLHSFDQKLKSGDITSSGTDNDLTEAKFVSASSEDGPEEITSCY